jgi:hypothetical protein
MYHDLVEPKLTKPEVSASLKKLDIPDDDIAKMLDWDAPLSEQPKAVRGALERGGFIKTGKISQATEPNGRIIFRDDSGRMIATATPESILETGGGRSGYRLHSLKPNGADIQLSRAAIDGDQAAKVVKKWWSGSDITGERLLYNLGRGSDTSEALRKAGIPGLKYYDQMSRGGKKGTRNYVVWDQDVLNRTKILAQ